MKHSYILVIILAVLVGGIAATYVAIAETHPDNVTCANQRLVAFGWTHKQKSLAELAAILRWQQTVEAERPGFGQWHQAYKRSLSCRIFKDSRHYQCQLSAKPCRYGET